MNDVGAILNDAPWLTLGTADALGHPLATYAPFALVPGGLAIAVSGLAAHTRHLLEQRRASVLVLGVASAGVDTYAQPRVTLECAVRTGRDADEDVALWAALEARHGEVVQTLRTLPDFRPLVLEPSHARLVLGFGAALDVAGPGILRGIEEVLAFQPDRSG